MTPEAIAKSGSESAHQKAVFAWSAMAQLHGFAIAGLDAAYSAVGLHSLAGKVHSNPVPALRWLHSIPNGGARDAITAARMKGEGLRRGVPDVFLPVARRGFHGLYIEMKKGKDGRQSDEQREFEQHCSREHFAFFVCRSWQEARDTIQGYLT